MKITLIGLGIMGSRMAHNLLKQGVSLTVWNRSPKAMEPLAAAGAMTAPTALDAVKDADIVITMLAKPEAVAAVMHGDTLQAMKENALWIDSSTVNPSFSRESAVRATQAGIRYLDAPVAGTLPQAANAELIFFVGGNAQDVEEATPYLDMMRKKVMHIGDTGMGASFKMLVNSMLAQSMLIFSETVLLGEKMGLDSEFLLNTLPNLAVIAPFTKAKAGMMKADEYDVMFPLELMHKDMHLATTTAYEVGQSMPFANAAKERYADAVQAGMGRLDFAAIHRFLEKM
jgi:3-hydroxyisobutyrate dehydrogenase-like beta-hydroxyacid dehydrogenase